MLTELRIENFAIIQSLELSFHEGLTAVTGETGAGKSIILDAITALVGGKADVSMVRSGADRAILEAEFRLPAESKAAILALLEAEELMDDSERVTLGREIRREGRTVARINGRSVSLNLLREVGGFLVDIHGQSEHLSLLNTKTHLGLLDRFADFEDDLQAYRKDYHQLQGVRRELARLRQAEQDAAKKSELLAFQAGEIEAAHLQPEEEDELRQERNRLANAEALGSLIQQAVAVLDEGSDETPAVSDLLGRAVQALGQIARLDASQAGLLEQAETLEELSADLARDLRAYQDQIEFNPRRLEQVEERLEAYHALKRKYGGSVEAVLAYAAEARAQLEMIASAGERIAELEEAESALLRRMSGQAGRLSLLRREAARKMEQGVERELADLSMAGAQFRVDIQTRQAENGLPAGDGETLAFDENGVDQVEFLIAPNPGEGLKPLVKIASGGETSRLMLALKNVLAMADAIPTLIFDEIDQGIGGRVGMVVGEKLWQLGRRHQVLCVTHLPQLAAFGNQHWHVTKLVADGRTSTAVEVLTGERRLDELASMLGGINAANRAAAEETLRLAQSRIAGLDFSRAAG